MEIIYHNLDRSPSRLSQIYEYMCRPFKFAGETKQNHDFEKTI